MEIGAGCPKTHQEGSLLAGLIQMPLLARRANL